MKKIICSLILFLFIWSSVYSSNNKIESKLERINTKLEILFQQRPQIIEKLYNQISIIEKRIKPGTDTYFLIVGIKKKTEELLNKWKEIQEEIVLWVKNTFNNSFTKSKKYLESSVYNTSTNALTRKTFYCGCDYSTEKVVDSWDCGFKNNGKYESRSKKIEWEHIVPAHAFWQSFQEWSIGNEECIDSKWKAYHWRRCASKVNKEYRYMESDMYNLVPSIWSINAQRSNYFMSDIPGEEREFGSCDIEIENKEVEPGDNIKWDIARIYMYMNITYPGKEIIPEGKKELFNSWNEKDPISEEECSRYRIIKAIQKNENMVLKEACE